MYSMGALGTNGTPAGPSEVDLARAHAAGEAQRQSQRYRIIYSIITGMAGGMAAAYMQGRRDEDGDLSQKAVVGAATGLVAAGLLNLGFYAFGRTVLPRT